MPRGQAHLHMPPQGAQAFDGCVGGGLDPQGFDRHMGPAACHFTDARGGVAFGGVDHVFGPQRQGMGQACGHNIDGHNPRAKGFADQQRR